MEGMHAANISTIKTNYYTQPYIPHACRIVKMMMMITIFVYSFCSTLRISSVRESNLDKNDKWCCCV